MAMFISSSGRKQNGADFCVVSDYSATVMTHMRLFLARHPQWIIASLLLCLMMKAMIPAGFMLSLSSGTVLTVTICSETTGGLRSMKMAIPNSADDPANHDGKAGQEQGHCAFSGLGQVALGGTDVVLLVAALAFILLRGLAPVLQLPVRRAPYLRPPLRGPPLLS